MNSEATLIVEAVRTSLLLLAAFGILITQEQQTAILAAVPAILAVISLGLAWFNRQKVFAADTVQEIANAATFLPPGTEVFVGEPPEGAVDGA